MDPQLDIAEGIGAIAALDQPRTPRPLGTTEDLSARLDPAPGRCCVRIAP